MADQFNVDELCAALNEREQLYRQVTALQKKCNEQLDEIRRLNVSPASSSPKPSFDRAKFAEFIRTHKVSIDAMSLYLGETVHNLKGQEASGINNEGVDTQVDYIQEQIGMIATVELLKGFL